LLALLKTILGDDIILWGARVIHQEPGVVHDWHTDIESAAPHGRFVSVWIGLQNTRKESALSLASRSHRFGKPIQQVVNERRLSRSDATNDAVAAWAREFDRAATIVQPDMKDGQARLRRKALARLAQHRTSQTFGAVVAIRVRRHPGRLSGQDRRVAVPLQH
jgi:ectoine hydroxylase-related dioxygenase (phytanoyl-CoA dioxygenase family)